MADTTPTMLTTEDNPYNPFIQYDEWEAFDRSKGYNTPSYLARVVVTSDELTESEEEAAILQGIDSIVALNVLGIYKKVTPADFPKKV
jgi:hypothetical protein